MRAVPTFKATEHTLRQPFIEALMGCIDEKDYRLLNELAYRENGLVRKIPDIVILREGKYREKDDVFHIN